MAFGRSLEEVQDTISCREFALWRAYQEIEPWGERRADFRMAILASLIVNVNRDPKKSRAAKPSDFMPKFGVRKRGKQSAAQILATMSGFAAAHNANLKQRKGTKP